MLLIHLYARVYVYIMCVCVCVYVCMYVYIYIYIYKVILTYARQCSIHRSRAMYILWEEKDIIRQKRHFLIEKKRYTYFANFFKLQQFQKQVYYKYKYI